MNIESLNLVIDLNRDGAYSPWELWEAVKWVYRLPGNLLVEGLGHIPYLSTLLNIQASEATGYRSLNGSLSVTLSLMLWVVAIFSLLTWLSPTVDEPDDASLDAASARRSPATGAAHARLAEPDGKQGHDEAAAPHARPHLPVSRANYAAPGKKPKRHRRHHRLVNYLISHAK
ncbi:hypothetical protein RE432_10310 [Pusillimonas sp. SM2304]|uniref:hypothetical protein n=1 Tax=Pusillimonas sp. SM2304 TaxID=3073241 RepID=UPI002874E01C|nr:hypothetical protein [Pusillimonas sp. SM2304]MDS1140828.1 hypothetical protein [Pusillimonas sp. SM2304]